MSQAPDRDAATPEEPRTGQRGVRSVEVSFGLLAIMAAVGRPIALGELAARASLAPTRVHAHLVSLKRSGVVEQDGETGRYRLGPFALTLGLARLGTTRPTQLAVARVPAFAERLSLMVTLSVWGTHGPTIVHVEESGRQIHANVRAGGVFQVSTTATGRVFAAFLAPSVVEEVLARELAESGGADGFDRPAFDAGVAAARSAGFATTRDRPVPGVSAAAAPVFDHAGQVQLVATVIGPTGRIDVAAGGPHVAALVEWTAALSRDLGFRAGPAADKLALVQGSSPAA